MIDDRIGAARRRFAEEIAKQQRVGDPRLVEAFASIPRERYLGPGPWHILKEGYVATPDDDPARVYVNAAIALDPGRNINNGEPGLHIGLLAALDPRPGDHIVHIGVGGGYYTAILARLVQPGGRITAIEYDGGLTRRASENLADSVGVTLIHGDGTKHRFDPADGIYVNAGASRPCELWLDRLNPNGRLLMMLTDDQWWGQALKVVRMGPAYSAALLGQCGFIPCVNGRDGASNAALTVALRRGATESVRSLRRDTHLPDGSCWMHGDGFCLSMRSPA